MRLRCTRMRLAAAVAAALLLLAPPAPAQTSDTLNAGGTSAQAAGTTAVRADRTPEPVSWRFPVGEAATYDVQVALGRVNAPRPLGEARLAVEGREVVDGVSAYRLALEMEGGIPFVYQLDDRQVSWVGTGPLRTLRFEEHLRQGDYRRDRLCRMDQRAGRYSCFREEEGDWVPIEGRRDVPMPEDALDEISLLYLVRSLPLEPGDRYRFDRLFEEDGNPVEIEVLRREEIRVPAGRFATIVVRPTIRTDGLFGQEGRAEVYITDDERRAIVKIASTMKMGRIDLLLTEYRPGDEGPPDG